MNAAPHWAAEHIGKPYARGADGPDAFDCWGWVRFVFRTRHGIEMPHVQVGELADANLDNVAAIKQAAAVSGWSPVADRSAADRDVVLMNCADGRHIGVMARVDGRLLLLHSFQGAGVCAQTLEEAQLAGFTGFVFWRHA